MPPRTRNRLPPSPARDASSIRAARFEQHGDEYVVFSFPERVTILPRELSPAERAVAESILAGDSNAAIATQRGTSLRTVANQVASLFRKLGVHSRAEFIARVTGSSGRRT